LVATHHFVSLWLSRRNRRSLSRGWRRGVKDFVGPSFTWLLPSHEGSRLEWHLETNDWWVKVFTDRSLMDHLDAWVLIAHAKATDRLTLSHWPVFPELSGPRYRDAEYE
jgi:hypothetical protein